MTEYEADIVIAGGGTTACVIAGRLAEAWPDLSILLVESGREITDNERVAKPLDGLFSVYEGADQIRYMQSEPLGQLEGRAPVVPVGNLVGGSSSINFMMYNNPAASDFDDWDTPGWSFSELRPFIHKSERWEVEGVINPVHGRHGRMPVSSGGHQTPYTQAYFDAFAAVKGLPFAKDIVDYKTSHGCGFLPKLISSRDGVRSNTASVYLNDRGLLRPGSNVKLLSNQTVDRVVFDGDRASGLELSRTPLGPLIDAEYRGQKSRAKAMKMVIVCAGTFGSAPILERSGIGNRSLLQDLGIDVLVDLPGVGAEYQDHELTICSYRLSDDAETLDDYARGDVKVKAASDAKWRESGKGMTATNGFDVAHKIRPSEEDIKEMGPEFAAHWDKVAGGKLDKPVYSGPMVNYFMGPTPRPVAGKFFSMGAFLNYPAGRGSVHIRSSNPNAPVRFDAGLLTHAADMAVHVWAYK